MPMYVVLKSYLAELEAQENIKPADNRKPVPSITELASILGINQSTLSRLANNKIRSVNLDTGDKLISEMRNRGFDMKLTDFIVYRPD